MATGDWTVYRSGDPDTLAAALKTAGVVVADETHFVMQGSTFYAFVVEA